LALFEPDANKTVVFDVFIAPNDMRLKEFHVFENLWKETLLLSYLKNNSDQVAAVYNFG